MCLGPFGGAFKCRVQYFLHPCLRDHVGSFPPVGDRADGYSEVRGECLVGHAERLSERVGLAAGPRANDFHYDDPALHARCTGTALWLHGVIAAAPCVMEEMASTMNKRTWRRL